MYGRIILLVLVRKSLLEQLSTNTIKDINFTYSKTNLTLNTNLICDVIRENTFTIFEDRPELYDDLRNYVLSTASMYGISDDYFLYDQSNDRNDTKKTGIK